MRTGRLSGQLITTTFSLSHRAAEFFIVERLAQCLELTQGFLVGGKLLCALDLGLIKTSGFNARRLGVGAHQAESSNAEQGRETHEVTSQSMRPGFP